MVRAMYDRDVADEDHTKRQNYFSLCEELMGYMQGDLKLVVEDASGYCNDPARNWWWNFDFMSFCDLLSPSALARVTSVLHADHRYVRFNNWIDTHVFSNVPSNIRILQYLPE